MAELVNAHAQGRVGIVTIARPERRNALNLQVKQEIVGHLQALADDAGVAVIVLTGEGGCFVAGTDIGEMVQMSPTDHVRLDTDRVFHAVRRSPKPVIAAVEGYALGGGCELAMACDMIVAADDAQFGQPEIRVGIMPGAGGTQRLLRTVGRYKALMWSLTGQMVPAREAFAANLVSELVAKGQALPRSIQIAEQIAAMPPLAVQAIREAVRLGADVPLETALALERRLFERLFDTQDQKKACARFWKSARRPTRGADHHVEDRFQSRRRLNGGGHVCRVGRHGSRAGLAVQADSHGGSLRAGRWRRPRRAGHRTAIGAATGPGGDRRQQAGRRRHHGR
jgi:enoyl-CoA hydratase/carnithine racemase